MYKKILWLLAALACYAQADTVYLTNGRVIADVTILEESHEVVKMESLGGDSLPPRRTVSVSWIQYSDAPDEIAEGRNLLQTGQPEEAVYLLKEAVNLTKEVSSAYRRSLIEQQAHFYLAAAYQKWTELDPSITSNYNQAIRYYKLTLKAPKTRFFYDCHFGLAQCYIHLKKYDEADRSLQKLLQQAESAKEKKWIFEGKYWQGHALLARGNHRSAIGKYREATRYAQEKEMVTAQREARFAIGNAYIDQGEIREAQNHFEEMKAEAKKDDWELLAGVENGLAASYLAKGEARKARRLAIKVIIEYYQAVKERARALYIAGQCYEKLMDKEKGARDRAKVYYRFLQEGYPNNQWTLKALQHLQKLSQE